LRPVTFPEHPCRLPSDSPLVISFKAHIRYDILGRTRPT
jgi:hypothetical protein